MHSAAVIARLTILEGLRRHIWLVTFFLGVIISVVPVVANVFGLGSSERVVKDVGLTVIGYYGVFLALLMGSSAVPGEIERKTIYPLLTRPLPRRSYLWGKWAGMMVFVVLSLTLLALCLMASSALFIRETDPRILYALVGYLVEDGVLMAACMFFSTFASPPLAGVLGAFVYVLGGLPDEFVRFFLVQRAGDHLAANLAWIFKAIFPHFQFFHVKDAIVHADPLPGLYILSVVAYGLVWVGMWQVLAEWTFERKDL